MVGINGANFTAELKSRGMNKRGYCEDRREGVTYSNECTDTHTETVCILKSIHAHSNERRQSKLIKRVER